MAKGKFKYVEGATNTGESEERIAARRTEDGNTEVAYAAYGGMRVVELNGEVQFDDINSHLKLVKELHDQVGDDFEIMLAVKVSDDAAVIAVGSMDEVTWAGCDPRLEVVASNVLEPEDLEDCEDEDLLMTFQLALAQ